MTAMTLLDEDRVRRYMRLHCRGHITIEALEEAAYLVTAPANQVTQWCDLCADRHDPGEHWSPREQLASCHCDVWDRCDLCRAAHLEVTGRPIDARRR